MYIFTTEMTCAKHPYNCGDFNTFLQYPPQGRAFWDPKFKGTARPYFSPVLGILPLVLIPLYWGYYHQPLQYTPQGFAFSYPYSDPSIGPYFLVLGNY